MESNMYWYISQTRHSHFDLINVLGEDKGNANWDGYIWFTSEEEAEKFRRKLIAFIRKEYKPSVERGWFPDVPLNNGEGKNN